MLLAPPLGCALKPSENFERLSDVNPEWSQSENPIQVNIQDNSQTECAVARHQCSAQHKKVSCSIVTVLHDDFIVKHPLTQPGELRWAIESSSEPLVIVNHFQSSKKIEHMDLADSSWRMFHSPNAGGNSLESEVLSFELLHRCYQAKLLKTEMEIEYFPECSKKTDYSVVLYGRHIGVSVTRAMKFKGVFTHEDAQNLLEKKLYGIIESSDNVVEHHRWDKQILHVWASHGYIADIIACQFEQISRSLQLDTVVIITVSDVRSRNANIFTSNREIADLIFQET